mgnify:CR=1 FL=1
MHLELEAFNITQKISMDGRSRRAAKNLCRCGGSFSSSGKKIPTSKVGDELRPLYYMTTICINAIMWVKYEDIKSNKQKIENRK